MADDVYVIFQVVAIVSTLFAVYVLMHIGVNRYDFTTKKFNFYFNMFKVFAIIALGAAISPIFIVIFTQGF